jgi:acyl carrier protein
MKERIKSLIIENLMLRVSPAEITDDQPLFGPGGLGLDSVDALQLVLALDKHFGLKIRDPEMAKEVFRSVNTITEAVQQKLAASGGNRWSDAGGLNRAITL